MEECHMDPKRMQRQIRKQMQETGIGTKARQALKLMQEEGKVARKAKFREQREAEQARRFELRQQKRKEKHRGH